MNKNNKISKSYAINERSLQTPECCQKSRGFSRKPEPFGSASFTDGAGGIGLAPAKRFARAGVHQAVVDMNPSGLDTAEKEIRALGGRCIGVCCNISVKDDCDAAISRILNHYGGIDALINKEQT